MIRLLSMDVLLLTAFLFSFSIGRYGAPVKEDIRIHID